MVTDLNANGGAAPLAPNSEPRGIVSGNDIRYHFTMNTGDSVILCVGAYMSLNLVADAGSIQVERSTDACKVPIIGSGPSQTGQCVKLDLPNIPKKYQFNPEAVYTLCAEQPFDSTFFNVLGYESVKITATADVEVKAIKGNVYIEDPCYKGQCCGGTAAAIGDLTTLIEAQNTILTNLLDEKDHEIDFEFGVICKEGDANDGKPVRIKYPSEDGVEGTPEVTDVLGAVLTGYTADDICLTKNTDVLKVTETETCIQDEDGVQYKKVYFRIHNVEDDTFTDAGSAVFGPAGVIDESTLTGVTFCDANPTCSIAKSRAYFIPDNPANGCKVEVFAITTKNCGDGSTTIEYHDTDGNVVDTSAGEVVFGNFRKEIGFQTITIADDGTLHSPTAPACTNLIEVTVWDATINYERDSSAPDPTNDGTAGYMLKGASWDVAPYRVDKFEIEGLDEVQNFRFVNMDGMVGTTAPRVELRYICQIGFNTQ